MTSLLKQILCYVAEEQFESLAFMFPVPAEGEAAPVSEWATVRVGFSGPFGGSLCMALPSEMLPVLAANMLGMDDRPPGRAEQLDALKELMNVVCGNLLPAIAGAEAVFGVGAPELVGFGTSPQFPSDIPPDATVRVSLDEGCAELWLSVDRPAGEMDKAVAAAVQKG